MSRQDYDDAVAGALQADADVLSAKADVEMASLNLGYATVTAPITGRIGKAEVTEGALVGQNEATPLATIQQMNPVYWISPNPRRSCSGCGGCLKQES